MFQWIQGIKLAYVFNWLQSLIYVKYKAIPKVEPNIERFSTSARYHHFIGNPAQVVFTNRQVSSTREDAFIREWLARPQGPNCSIYIKKQSSRDPSYDLSFREKGVVRQTGSLPSTILKKYLIEHSNSTMKIINRLTFWSRRVSVMTSSLMSQFFTCSCYVTLVEFGHIL